MYKDIRFKYFPFKEEELIHNLDETYMSSLMFKLNNFFCHFIIKNTDYSNGYRKIHYDESAKRFIRKFPDLTNNRDTSLKVNEFEFYKDLDLTVTECGNTNEKIRDLITSWYESGRDDKNTEILFKALAPIYKGMRNKGYLRYHLWT